MKKLRLIKPWKLRATRQKLADTRYGFEDTDVYYASCAAPGHHCAGVEEESSRFGGVDVRCPVGMPAAHQIASTAAPRGQDVVFSRGFTAWIR